MRSPRQAQKKHHSNAALCAVGGTPNPVRHLLGGTDPQDTNRTFAVVTERPISSYVPATTSWGYDHSTAAHSGAKRSDGVLINRPALCLDTLLRRAERKGMTLVQYCEWADLPLSNYTV